MFRNWFGFDWRKSQAHLLLLSKFLAPAQSDFISNPDEWQTVLGEDIQKAVKRFLQEGFLIEADLAGKLDARLKVTELKDLLKQRGLKVSGRKSDLIQRLIDHDQQGMEHIIRGIRVLICSDEGRRIAEDYRAQEDAERQEAENQVWQLLQSGKLRSACEKMAEYEAKQVFPRGLDIDWKNYTPDQDEAMLRIIFSKTPKILSGVSLTKLDTLRMAAAMSMLWGTSSVRRWLPPDFTSDVTMDAEAAARMFEFYAHSLTAIAEYKASNVVKQVQVLSVSDCCPECKKINGRRFDLNKAIELPYEHCTHRMGCRCTWIAVMR